MLMCLVDQVKPDFLSKHKSLCEFLLSSMLMIHSESDKIDQKTNSPLNEEIKIFKFSSVNLSSLIKNSFKLIRFFKCPYENQVYFKIFKIFIFVNYSSPKYL